MSEKEFEEMKEMLLKLGFSQQFIDLAEAAYAFAKSGNARKDIQLLTGGEQ